MSKTRVLLLASCMASPIAAALLAAVLPVSPVLAALAGAVLGVLVLLPSLRAAENHTAHKFCERVLDVIPYPVSVKDAGSRLRLVNNALLDYKKQTRKALIGTEGHIGNESPEWHANRLAEDQQVLQGLPVWKEEHIPSHPVTGKEVFQVIIKGRCLGLNRQTMIVSAQFDTTELRQAQRAAEETLVREIQMRERITAYIQRLIDVIPQPVYVKSAESRYQLINRAMLDDMHKDAGALLGKNPLDLGAKPEYAALVMGEDQRIANGEVVYKEEHIKHPYTGQEVFRIISKRSCLDAEGRPVIVGANFDITPLRQAERSAAQASEAKSLFLATMSHEIRTPLNGVIGMLRIALKREIDATTHEQLSISLRSAESLLTIINDILDFSKIEAGHLHIEEIDFDLRATVSEALQTFSISAQERSVALVIDVADELPAYFKGDPTRLRQILINLTGNALKFTKRGAVTLRLRPAMAGLTCEVIDTGIGIPTEALPRMFQKFQQADSSTTRKFGGTGLGLAICKQLVEAMGGTISVTSTEGQGSCFRFNLLLKPGKAPDNTQTQALEAQGRALSILCAEDSATNQIIIQSLTESLGHRITMANDGLEALEHLASEDYDVVLMDGRMPKLDGHTAARAIRAGTYNALSIRNPAIPIVALTANVSDIDINEFREAGANDFLAKPIDEHQLAQVLARISQAPADRAPTALAPAVPPPSKLPMAERLKAMLIKSLPARIAEIDTALSASNHDALVLLFHGLKGNASYSGDHSLAPQAAILESAALEHQHDTLVQRWPALRQALMALSSHQAA